MTESEYRTIKFSKDWLKLTGNIFTTIRSHGNEKFRTAEPGTEWVVRTPSAKFEAVLLMNQMSSIEDLPTALLTYDTSTETREGALKELNSFYKNPLSLVQLMLFRRINT